MKIKLNQVLTVKHGHTLKLKPCVSGEPFEMLDGGVCHVISFTKDIVRVKINSVEEYEASRSDVILRCRENNSTPINMMKNIKWVRVINVQPYIDSENYSNEYPDKRVRRLYHAEGSDYPLFLITISANSDYVVLNKPFTGIRISVSFKEKEGDWWDDSAFNSNAWIPPQLYDELEDMLAEAKRLFK